ncbi:MAG: beta-ketoacyl-ACP synthase III [Bacteroidetes bacterium]|jgi:3-oxoacyl-[acyl-carrier-protein] synthase-3|nr:beta-ketoacyl-ACP synthase III [Bacteroidota bacterium]MBK8327918.1 beta-ketoacyl-ACP synthase III [Bacteroidota bacterium]MBK9299640.1 beta-ketoacyl-ACP synthase III [Bacteroidota bacterium]
MSDVFINRLAKFLPNNPVTNDEMEDYLGKIDGRPSKAKGIILRNNQIKTRYYAIDKRTGKCTHTNYQLAAKAVEGLLDNQFKKDDIELLACGCVAPDQLLPSHAAMVHGELNCKPTEIVSISTACCAGIQAFKYAFMSVKSGNSANAVAVGSEKVSAWLKADKFDEEAEDLKHLEENPMIAFEKDFLRWMLSDGAGAVLMQNHPNENNISLRVDWVDILSFANQIDPCMYAGCEKNDDGSLTGWAELTPHDWATKSIFAFKQDTRLLGENIVKWGGVMWKKVCEKHKIELDKITYFLPHLSSEFFRPKIMEELEKIGYPIPADKWFTNLTKVGNVGSASPYIMLEELFNGGKFKKGDVVILMVPESARFSYAYVQLTVV